jgi:hypothetical protein
MFDNPVKAHIPSLRRAEIANGDETTKMTTSVIYGLGALTTAVSCAALALALEILHLR